MKRTASLAAGMLLTAVSVAQAADAVDQVPTPSPAPQQSFIPTEQWSGLYGGGFIGYGWGDFDTNAGGIDADGALGGAFVGFNQQIGSVVYGLEADVGYSGVEGRLSGTTFDAQQEAFGSLRARLGYAFDPVLLYGTAGLAVTGAEVSNGAVSDTNTHLGYTVGAGADVAVTENIFGRVEYRYSDFEDKTYNVGNTVVSSGFDSHTVSTGIGFKF